MTLNVVVKCPDGIVMGADSLVTILNERGTVSMIIPYYSKLFPLSSAKDYSGSPEQGEDFSQDESKGSHRYFGFAAGVVMNGDTTYGGRPIADMIEDFGETYDKQATNSYSLFELTQHLGETIQEAVDDKQRPLALEVIVGGYSRGKRAAGKRFGEVYSLFWRVDPDNPSKPSKFNLRELYRDKSVGTYYGGITTIPDRFLYGIDDRITDAMWDRRGKLFDQVRDYIFELLESRKIKIPEKVKQSITVPQRAEECIKHFNVFNLITQFEKFKGFNSAFDVNQILNYATSSDFEVEFKKHMTGRLETMERFFSLQTAVNYCTFLLWCAYAESEFTPIISRVGSEMKVATVTRHDGFMFRKIWKIQTPGPPFR